MSVSTDRWTCPHPTCGTTVHAGTGGEDKRRTELRRAREAHGRRHARQAVTEVATELEAAR